MVPFPVPGVPKEMVSHSRSDTAVRAQFEADAVTTKVPIVSGDAGTALADGFNVNVQFCWAAAVAVSANRRVNRPMPNGNGHGNPGRTIASKEML